MSTFVRTFTEFLNLKSKDIFGKRGHFWEYIHYILGYNSTVLFCGVPIGLLGNITVTGALTTTAGGTDRKSLVKKLFHSF